MSDEIRWLIGIAASLGVAFFGVFWAAYRGVIAKFDRLGNDVKRDTDALHERVNRVRDEYVRRVDLDSTITRLDTALRELREDVKAGQAEEREGRKAVMELLRTVLTKGDR